MEGGGCSCTLGFLEVVGRLNLENPGFMLMMFNKNNPTMLHQEKASGEAIK